MNNINEDFKADALNILCPNGWGDNGETITTTSDPVPTKAEIDAQVAIILAEYEANEYARNRASAYDSIGDQLDMMMKDKRDGTTTHQTACEAVKAKFPKSA
tara:strand:- start:305 stop:610 length:306 start_codon:yes stop_codon:yes gene_type:complete